MSKEFFLEGMQLRFFWQEEEEGLKIQFFDERQKWTIPYEPQIITAIKKNWQEIDPNLQKISSTKNYI